MFFHQFALRDHDATSKSLSSNEKEFITSCAAKGLRLDGRKAGELRPFRLDMGRTHNRAECTAQLGSGTRVHTCVSGDLIPPPHADRPSDGVVSISVQLSPMASIAYQSARPLSTHFAADSQLGGSGPSGMEEGQKLLCNRILRILERTLLVGGAMDSEALCVQTKRWVWRLNVVVTALDDGGNLIDAAMLSVLAALRHYRKPEVNLDEGNGKFPVILNSDIREPSPLPLHHTPLSTTFALFAMDQKHDSAVAALLDPTNREELVMNGSITIAMNVHSELCLVDFGGGCELKPSQLKKCITLAERSILQLCPQLEEALEEANLKAVQTRMNHLKSAAANQEKSIMLEKMHETPSQGPPVFMDLDETDLSKSEVTEVATDGEKEEEAIRQQALDYSLGHVAIKVGDGTSKPEKNRMAVGGSLFEALLKSANASKNPTLGDATTSKSSAEQHGQSKRMKGSGEGENEDLQEMEISKESKEVAPKEQMHKQTSLNRRGGNGNDRPKEEDDEEETTVTLSSEFSTQTKK